VLTPETVAAATTQHTSGPDLVTHLPLHLGLGFSLPTPLAPWPPATAFGFSGLGGSIGFADPATGLAFDYVMNNIRNSPAAEAPAANLVTALPIR